MKCTITFLIALATTGYSKNTVNTEPKCQDIKLHIDATAQNWDLPAYPETTDQGTLVTYLSQTIPKSGFATKPKKTVSGTYKIAATFCEPTVKVPEREKSIQFLLHGFGSGRVRHHCTMKPH